MTQHRVYTQLDDLIALRLQANQLTLQFDLRRLQKVSGVHLSRFKGQGVDFAEFRQYQPGDDPRSIDWKVTARRGKPHTRIYHEDIERPVLIFIDQSTSMFFGSRFAFKSVRAAETGALLCWAALKHDDRTGGLVFSTANHQMIKPSRHPKQALRLLDCITDFNQSLKLPQNQTPDFDLQQALTELRRIAKPGSQCYLISDWRQFDKHSAQLLFELNRHCQLLVFQVFDPLEARLPPGYYKISDGQSEMQINTNEVLIEERFSQSYQGWQQQLIKQFADMGIACAPLSTWQHPLQTLLSLQAGSAATIADQAATGFFNQSAESQVIEAAADVGKPLERQR